MDDEQEQEEMKVWQVVAIGTAMGIVGVTPIVILAMWAISLLGG